MQAQRIFHKSFVFYRRIKIVRVEVFVSLMHNIYKDQNGIDITLIFTLWIVLIKKKKISRILYKEIVKNCITNIQELHHFYTYTLSYIYREIVNFIFNFTTFVYTISIFIATYLNKY